MGGRGASFGVNDKAIRELRERQYEARKLRSHYNDLSREQTNSLLKDLWKRKAAAQKSIISKLDKRIKIVEKNNYKVRGNPNNELTWRTVKA